MPARSVALARARRRRLGRQLRRHPRRARALPAAALQRAAVHAHGASRRSSSSAARGSRGGIVIALRLPARRGQVRPAVHLASTSGCPPGSRRCCSSSRSCSRSCFAAVDPARAAAARAGDRRRDRLRRARRDRRRPGGRGAPILPFLLILGAAAAWGVTNLITRVAQPPDPLAMLVWASLVPPLPLLGPVAAVRGPGARSATRSRASTRPGSARCCSSPSPPACSASRPGPAAQAPRRRRGHAVRAARPGVRDRQRRAAAGRAPERARAGRRGADLRRAGRDAGPRAALRGQGGRRLGAQPHGVVRPAVLGIDLGRVREHEARRPGSCSGGIRAA